jgi:hypothetical protein
MKDTRYRWLGEAAALLLPILLVSSPFLFGPRSLDGREFHAFHRSRALYAQEMTSRDGEWPRWNGRQYAGTPFLGDLHGSLHYPPNLLFLVLAPERAFGYLFVFHMLVAAIGMYRIGRYFEFRRSASVLGGVAYGVSFSVAAHMSAGSLSHFVTPAMAPWVLLLILRLLKRVSTFRIVLLAVALGAVLLGGTPQDLPFLLLLCLGLIVWTAVDAGRRKRPWKKAALGPIALSALLGLALSLASILPALEVREHAVLAFAPAEVARDWRILYVGVLPTLVAILPFQAPKRGPTLYFAIAAVVSLLPPLLLPRLPVCSFWVTALSLCGLTASGWDGLSRGRYAPRTVVRILAAVGALALVAAGLVVWRFRILVESAALLGLLGITAWIVTKLHARPVAIVAAILVTAADLCFFDLREIRTLDEQDYAAPPWYASRIGPERWEYRLLDQTTRDATPGIYGFRLLEGYGYPRLRNLDLATTPLEDLNVRWIVTERAPEPGGPWREIARDGSRRLLENAETKRSAFLKASDDALGPPLKILRTANTIEVEGRTYQAGQLVVSESWMPGWKAFMQRREVPALSGDHALITVDIPAGDWYVVLRYEPDAYRIGRIVSSSAVALLLALLVAGMKRSKMAIS